MFLTNGIHHGYIGILLLIIAAVFKINWLLIISVVLIIDELIQMITKNQYGGFIHWLYVNTLYKIPLIKKINIWFDKLLGK